MKDENKLYWIWLAECCGIASREFGRLVERYDDPFDLYRLDEDEIEHLEGIGNPLKRRLCQKSLEGAYAILRYCKTHGVDVLPYTDTRYPARLRSIEDPPVLLYALGKMPDMNNRLCVGVVGTRKMSEYGRQTAYKISYELAAANTVIVSGMALGVDAVAACGALAADGTTVAVLGSGISVVYPKQHERLMKEIQKHGVVVTEYPPMEGPNGANFPRRNRIISGLCQGVLVVEGDAGSGALITAKRAIAQGRDLFALPGKINEINSDGPNDLIRNGANVALCAEDVLQHFDFLYHDMMNYKGLNRARNRMVPEETALRRYGVSASYEGGRRDRQSRTATAAAAAKTVARSSEREGTEAIESPSKMTTAPSAPSQATEQTSHPDQSAETLASLDDVTRQVFAAMPVDRAVSPDSLMPCGITMGEVITSLTLLELSGLVSSLPGGLYQRK